MVCLNCNQDTHNPKFCSRSCSVSFNNKLIPKRTKKQFNCKTCHTPLITRNKYCTSCCIQGRSKDWSKVTKESMHQKRSYQVNSRIRELARKIFLETNSKPKCVNCGYNKHIEVCHKKPINSFPKNTKISTINDITNLVSLCRNCHWEFDHGLLDLSFRHT
jgi:hypothetical protein